MPNRDGTGPSGKGLRMGKGLGKWKKGMQTDHNNAGFSKGK